MFTNGSFPARDEFYELQFELSLDRDSWNSALLPAIGSPKL
jgi:hypothetical protein